MSPKKEAALTLLIKNYKLCVTGDRALTLEEIAQSVGITRRTLYNYMHNDEEFIAEYERRVHEAIKYTAMAAQATMVSLLDSPNDKVRQAAAKDILDRAGYKATEDVSVHGDAVRVTIVDDMGG